MPHCRLRKANEQTCCCCDRCQPWYRARDRGRTVADSPRGCHLPGRVDAAESLAAATGATIIQSDISSRADREALVAFAVEKFGRIDLLVNNAGMAPRERRDIVEATEESFDELIATNLKGPHFLTQLASRQMLAQGGPGRIVFVTSISSYTASVNRGEYCISKAGLGMSVALWAARLAPARIGRVRDSSRDHSDRHDLGRREDL